MKIYIYTVVTCSINHDNIKFKITLVLITLFFVSYFFRLFILFIICYFSLYN